MISMLGLYCLVVVFGSLGDTTCQQIPFYPFVSYNYHNTDNLGNSWNDLIVNENPPHLSQGRVYTNLDPQLVFVQPSDAYVYDDSASYAQPQPQLTRIIDPFQFPTGSFLVPEQFADDSKLPIFWLQPPTKAALPSSSENSPTKPSVRIQPSTKATLPSTKHVEASTIAISTKRSVPKATSLEIDSAKVIKKSVQGVQSRKVVRSEPIVDQPVTPFGSTVKSETSPSAGKIKSSSYLIPSEIWDYLTRSESTSNITKKVVKTTVKPPLPTTVSMKNVTESNVTKSTNGSTVKSETSPNTGKIKSSSYLIPSEMWDYLTRSESTSSVTKKTVRTTVKPPQSSTASMENVTKSNVIKSPKNLKPVNVTKKLTESSTKPALSTNISLKNITESNVVDVVRMFESSKDSESKSITKESEATVGPVLSTIVSLNNVAESNVIDIFRMLESSNDSEPVSITKESAESIVEPAVSKSSTTIFLNNTTLEPAVSKSSTTIFLNNTTESTVIDVVRMLESLKDPEPTSFTKKLAESTVEPFVSTSSTTISLNNTTESTVIDVVRMLESLKDPEPVSITTESPEPTIKLALSTTISSKNMTESTPVDVVRILESSNNSEPVSITTESPEPTIKLALSTTISSNNTTESTPVDVVQILESSNNSEPVSITTESPEPTIKLALSTTISSNNTTESTPVNVVQILESSNNSEPVSITRDSLEWTTEPALSMTHSSETATESVWSDYNEILLSNYKPNYNEILDSLSNYKPNLVKNIKPKSREMKKRGDRVDFLVTNLENGADLVESSSYPTEFGFATSSAAPSTSNVLSTILKATIDIVRSTLSPFESQPITTNRLDHSYSSTISNSPAATEDSNEIEIPFISLAKSRQNCTNDSTSSFAAETSTVDTTLLGVTVFLPGYSNSTHNVDEIDRREYIFEVTSKAYPKSKVKLSPTTTETVSTNVTEDLKNFDSGSGAGDGVNELFNRFTTDTTSKKTSVGGGLVNRAFNKGA